MLLWFASGLLMSVLPIERVHGDHLIDRSAQNITIDADHSALGRILQTVGRPVREVRLRSLLDRPVVEVEGVDSSLQLFDGQSGHRLSPLNEQWARSIAMGVYRGAGKQPSTALHIAQASTEYRGPLPAWQLAFPDEESTRIYVSANTGRITAVRNGTWRLYDFFWGLHIMDWKNHEDFNTPWLMAFAAGGLVLALCGTVLLYFRWPKKRRKPKAL
ncbi:hypothetical protein [Novosphingobium sp. CECT 9465]|uniref:hypothetical protein n=1 Tax=Novosphingobium sp. CECT 9465 TaxID=2829794 RepID=UPI001E4B8F19